MSAFIAWKLTVCPLLPQNRSPCLPMPGTRLGCRLMAERDRRSNMETGTYHQLSLSAAVSFHRFLFLRFRINFPPAFLLNSIKITTSCYPVPSICCHDLVYDWFESLAQCLHWNVRKRQARLADVSDSSDTENWISGTLNHCSPQQLSEWEWGVQSCSETTTRSPRNI